jgi:hypothetical protein
MILVESVPNYKTNILQKLGQVANLYTVRNFWSEIGA